MKTLSLFAVEPIDHLVQPEEFAGPQLDSPAINIVTDFRHSQPTTINYAASAADALDTMQHENVRLKLVVDQDNEMIGLITLESLSDQSIMRHVANGTNRNDISVSDLMTPRSHLKALAYEQLQHCTIADIVNTLQSNGEQYCLVIDRESHHIRGVISAQDIAKRLHIPLQIHKAPTFLSIFDSLYA
ncbi:CBS domain-containing protein [Chromatiaceae bacterium AAb-1]|nr:CBS domain-containing protein [Chromatiaceae bacterium AAb-1]